MKKPPSSSQSIKPELAYPASSSNNNDYDNNTSTTTTITLTIKRISTISEFESSPNLMAALFSHATAVPPFGPFASISAADFCSKMLRVPQDEVLLVADSSAVRGGRNEHAADDAENNGNGNTMSITVVYEIEPELVMAMYMKIWEIDQWRHMGHLYVPMDLKLNSVDQL